MIEPSVKSTRVNHVRHRKLANAAEPLERWRLNNLSLVTRQANKAMYRVPYSSLFAHGFKTFQQAFVLNSITDFQAAKKWQNSDLRIQSVGPPAVGNASSNVTAKSRMRWPRRSKSAGGVPADIDPIFSCADRLR